MLITMFKQKIVILYDVTTPRYTKKKKHGMYSMYNGNSNTINNTIENV